MRRRRVLEDRERCKPIHGKSAYQTRMKQPALISLWSELQGPQATSSARGFPTGIAAIGGYKIVGFEVSFTLQKRCIIEL